MSSDIPQRKIIREETVVDNNPPAVVQPVVQQPVVTNAPVVQQAPVVAAAPAAPVVQESVTSDVYDNPIERKVHSLNQISRLIYFVFGLLEILLLFRFVLKLLAANPNSGFGAFIYGLTEIFVAPFYGVLAQFYVPQTGSQLELPTLLAIAVYALISWAIVKLIWIIGDPGTADRTVTTAVNRRQRL